MLVLFSACFQHFLNNFIVMCKYIVLMFLTQGWKRFPLKWISLKASPGLTVTTRKDNDNNPIFEVFEHQTGGCGYNKSPGSKLLISFTSQFWNWHRVKYTQVFYPGKVACYMIFGRFR